MPDSKLVMSGKPAVGAAVMLAAPPVRSPSPVMTGRCGRPKPLVGPLTIDYHALTMPGEPDQTLFPYLPARHQASQDAWCGGIG